MSGQSTEQTEQTEEPHKFETCPDCGGELDYPTQADLLCWECGEQFFHEIRGDRHLLWRLDKDGGFDEVVARAN